MIVDINSSNGKKLRDKCVAVSSIENEVLPYLDEARRLVKELNAVGVAANQMGLTRAWYVDIHGDVYINPEVIASEGKVSRVEGCLSIKDRVYRTTRAEKVTLKYTNLDGEEVTKNLSGLDGHIAQHECDHLNGILLSDHGERIYADELKHLTHR